MDITQYKISADKLRLDIPEEMIAELQKDIEAHSIIGQPRAIKAIQLGINIQGRGYNIFVAGLPGTGRHNAIMQILEQESPPNRFKKDIAYGYNFKDPRSPVVLYFPAQTAGYFKRSLKRAIEKITKSIRQRLTSEAYFKKKNQLIAEIEKKERKHLSEFKQMLGEEGFILVDRQDKDQNITDIMPVLDGKAVEFDVLQELAEKGSISHTEVEDKKQKYFSFLEKLQDLFTKFDLARLSLEEELAEIQKRYVSKDVKDELKRLASRFAGEKSIEKFLGLMAQDILENIPLFLEDNKEQPEDYIPPQQKYTINIVHEVENPDKAPVVFVSQPDYPGLFGTIESIAEKTGEERSNYLMIRPGAVLDANGGFLILRVDDLLRSEDLWNTLKRVLLDNRLEIKSVPSIFSNPSALKPEPVDIDIKLILIGTEFHYEILFQQDEEFAKLFKLPAEFDDVLPLSKESIREYLGFFKATCKNKHLLPVTADGAAELLYYSARLAEDRSKLSAQFSLITDIIKEADYMARTEGKTEINAETVLKVRRQRQYLFGMLEEKLDEEILRGELLINPKGTATSRIHGLVVIDRGFYAFARPVLITARSAPGTEGIVNIERESGLSGEIHDKGVYIIQSFLQSRYARDFPLSIKAGITIEQSYVEIDGDSASLAEICALLSDITDLPLRQDIAVTGSINQMGEVQPVGGVTEKVEGFFTVCRKKGLTGTQGVIIPRLNINNLIPSREVLEAVEEGLFNIYAIDNIDQAMEILTGREAGVREAKGFKKGSINRMIEEKLRKMAMLVKNFEE
ncbi:AAA family ATPase [Spirochaetia bacterium 38H-sp]|uniref:endopeptidase La n=1 Tax=Rarispira pelagica TaxID=3141764 RepID=A0ABU9UAQ5_9SPIR